MNFQPQRKIPKFNLMPTSNEVKIYPNENNKQPEEMNSLRIKQHKQTDKAKRSQ